MANFTHITHVGLPGIDRIPFGMHTCRFYSDRDRLVAAFCNAWKDFDVVQLWLKEEER